MSGVAILQSPSQMMRATPHPLRSSVRNFTSEF